MRYIALCLILNVLAGCPSVTMTAEQLKASDGMATCTQLSSMYGKGSAITLNPDNVRKGASSKGKVTIGCGDASMTIETDVTAPVTPAKP